MSDTSVSSTALAFATTACIVFALTGHPSRAGAAEPWTIVADLVGDDSDEGDAVGFAVALSGETALVGASSDDDNGRNSGSAYVFVRSSGTWTQQAKLQPPDNSEDDYFGVRVALSGDTAVVTAFRDDDNGENSGSAYVFARSGGVWTQEAKLLPADGTAGDRFGIAVALSEGSLLIGSYADDDNGPDSGSAYVFARSGGEWGQQAKLTPKDGAAGDLFGGSVALSGGSAMIGAWGDDDRTGSAYYFARSNQTWAEEAKLVPSDHVPGAAFGVATALSGDAALIGAFKDDDNGFLSGSAYYFVRSGAAWTEEAKLLPSDGESFDQFGISVAISGTTALIGTRHAMDFVGSVYAFERSRGLWVEQAKIEDPMQPAVNFGGAVALTAGRGLVGRHGRTYVLERLIFADGFESGDTSGWSAVMP